MARYVYEFPVGNGRFECVDTVPLVENLQKASVRRFTQQQLINIAVENAMRDKEMGFDDDEPDDFDFPDDTLDYDDSDIYIEGELYQERTLPLEPVEPERQAKSVPPAEPEPLDSPPANSPSNND